MARIFRFRPEAAIQLALAEAHTAGLPVQNTAVQQGLQAVVLGLYSKYGVSFTIDDSSPYYHQFAHSVNGQQQNLRPPGQPQAGWPQASVPVPQAAQVPPSWPQAPVPVPQAAQAPQLTAWPQAQAQAPQPTAWPQAQAPINLPQGPPPGMIFPGQPLPELKLSGSQMPPPPSHMGTGIRIAGASVVPRQAPLMPLSGSGSGSGLGDNATGVTTAPPPPAPTILE